MKWISVNDKLPEPKTLNDWYDICNEGLHNKNLVLVIGRFQNENGKVKIEIRPAMYVYNDDDDVYEWYGTGICNEVLFWCNIPELPNANLITVKGVETSPW